MKTKSTNEGNTAGYRAQKTRLTRILKSIHPDEFP